MPLFSYTTLQFTGAFSKGFAVLSMDDEFQRDREVNAARASTSTKEGVQAGFKQLGRGLFDGITGLVMQPVRDARESGAAGVVTGTCACPVHPLSSVDRMQAWARASSGW